MVEEQYQQAKISIGELRNELQPPPLAHEAVPPGLHAMPAPAPNPEKTDVGTFSGKYADWPEFQDIFMNEVHDNPALTDGQRLKHLRKACLGRDKQLGSDCEACSA